MVNGSGITGGSQSTDVAPKGKRFLSALVDLLIVPVLLGIVAGLILIVVPEVIRNILLIAINIGWLIFRDTVFSPGRKLVNLKLVSLDGNKVTLTQAAIRNAFLMIPFVLVPGYGCEFGRVFIPAILWRRIWYSFISLLLVLGILAAVGNRSLLGIIIAVALFVIPIIFFKFDKEGFSEGNRLMDIYAKTRVVNA